MQLPPCPLVIALVPLKCSSRNLQFPHRVPFAKEKIPWCPCMQPWIPFLIVGLGANGFWHPVGLEAHLLA